MNYKNSFLTYINILTSVHTSISFWKEPLQAKASMS